MQSATVAVRQSEVEGLLLTSGREALNNYDDRVAVRRVEEAIRLD